MEREQISQIVERVLTRIHKGEMPASTKLPANPHGVYETVSRLSVPPTWPTRC